MKMHKKNHLAGYAVLAALGLGTGLSVQQVMASDIVPAPTPASESTDQKDGNNPLNTSITLDDGTGQEKTADQAVVIQQNNLVAGEATEDGSLENTETDVDDAASPTADAQQLAMTPTFFSGVTDRTEEKALNGIDISNWQGGIDVSKVPADFVIVKATGGTGFKDAYFKQFADKTLSTGKLLGFYHFARDKGYEGSANQEATFFYSNVKDYIGKGIPILDWEVPYSAPTQWCKEFLDTFYTLSGVRCMIYLSANTVNSYNWSGIANSGHKLWVAEYPDNKPQNGYLNDPWRGQGDGVWGDAVMHQYTSTGHLSGYGGNLDLNRFYGTKQDWLNLCKAVPVKAPDKIEAINVYRLYLGANKEHLYTIDKNEVKVLSSQHGWIDEGVAFTLPSWSKKPVYRLYHPIFRDHHYTSDKYEIDVLTANYGWVMDGISFYTAESGETPVYRLFLPGVQSGAHLFTTGKNEYDTLKKRGWVQEGIAYYSLKVPAGTVLSNTTPAMAKINYYSTARMDSPVEPISTSETKVEQPVQQKANFGFFDLHRVQSSLPEKEDPVKETDYLHEAV